jgi:hypothetical protein
VRYTGLETPLLACDISGFDHEYIDWNGRYEDYDLFAEASTDLDALDPSGGMTDTMRGVLFSQCKIYPTEANPDPLNKLDTGDAGDGVLWVEVVGATGLLAADLNGKSDPVTKVGFDGMCWCTSVCHESLDPEWEENFRVPIGKVPPRLNSEAQIAEHVKHEEQAAYHAAHAEDGADPFGVEQEIPRILSFKVGHSHSHTAAQLHSCTVAQLHSRRTVMHSCTHALITHSVCVRVLVSSQSGG